MPTISIDLRDLMGLVGRRLGPERLRGMLEMLGLEAEIGEREARVEVPHNRPDLLSTEGLARVLSGILGRKTGLPEYPIRESGVVVEVDRGTRDVRPLIAAGVAEGRLDERTVLSIMQLQEKLHDSLGRRRRKASIGVYDLDRVKPPIRYTTVGPDEIKFAPLGFSEEMTPAEIIERHPKGVEYGRLLAGLSRYPLLVDSEGRVLSMPPIVNSEETKVTENSKRLFIDVTGLDWKAVHGCLVIMLTAMGERGLRLGRVRIAGGGKSAVTPDLRPGRIRVGRRNVCETIGVELGTRDIASILRRMRYGVGKIGERFDVLFPPYRLDIMHEVDVIEDIAVGYGYGRLRPVEPSVLTRGREAEIERVSGRARLAMIGLGFTEVMTYTLTSREKACGRMGTDEEMVEIGNPVSSEYSAVRNSLIPSLLEVLAENQHHPTPQRIFEIGNVAIIDRAYETGARTVRRLAGAVAGREATFTYIRAVAEAVMREISVGWELREFEHPGFIPGRAVEILSGGRRIGLAGEVFPAVLERFGLENPAAVFELELGSI